MCSSQPTIGITVSARAPESAASRAAMALYVAAVEAHGARVVLLRPGPEAVTLEGLDALLLAGGGDIDPGWYWELPHPLLGEVERARDLMEIGLAREAARRGLPMLGICRGAQVIGVALGGTLHQDIGACVRRPLAHRSDGDQPVSHRIRLAEGCLLQQVLEQSELNTNSFHHQANARLGAEVRAVGWAEDGVVEAIEGPGRFLVGVQWHPERMVGEDEGQARLFGAFVEASRGGDPASLAIRGRAARDLRA